MATAPETTETEVTSIPTEVDFPTATKTLTPTATIPTITRVTDRITKGIQTSMEKVGVPKDNPVTKAVPKVVTTIIESIIPTPAKIAIEILSRNKTIAELIQNSTATTPLQTPDKEGPLPCIDDEEDSLCSKSNQGAVAWMSVYNNDLVFSLLEKLWPISQPSTSAIIQNQTPSLSPKITRVPVTVTVNTATGEIELSREDLLDTLEEYQTGIGVVTEEDIEEALYEQNWENPFVFNEAGEILYSNGLYAPAYENGYPIDDVSTQYFYIIKYINEFGQETEPITNNGSLPENLISKTIKKLFSNNSEFNFNDVETVTYRLIDPNTDTPHDSYYDYVFHLKDGDTRAVTVPEYTSIAFMEERFNSIGYKGSVIDLIGIAYEAFEKPVSLFGKVSALIQNYVGGFFDTNQSTDSSESVTELPVISNDIRAKDISNIFIYPLADVDCPVIDGASRGFAYNAIIKDTTNPDRVTMIADSRCGAGNAAALVEETSRHLSEKYNIKDLSYSTALNKTAFRFEPIIHSSGVFKAYIGDLPTENNLPTQPLETSSSTPTTPTSLPNLTNTISFEVKAVGSDGKVLSDWTSAEKIAIGNGVQLYLRWNGSDYQQCLPFLNDNGNYALTVKNRAMTSANTETEGYNLTERSGVYRIECGGQRNNEFGVDIREIEVEVR